MSARKLYAIGLACAFVAFVVVWFHLGAAVGLVIAGMALLLVAGYMQYGAVAACAKNGTKSTACAGRAYARVDSRSCP